MDKLSRTLLEKWQISASVPAFFFWGGVFLIWFLTHDCDFLPSTTIKPDIIRGVLIVALFYFLVVVSSNLVEWATFPALRLFEGYWESEWDAFPLIGDCISKEKKTKKIIKELEENRQYLEKLDTRYTTQEGGLSPEELKKCTKIYSKITNYPEDINYVRPTKLGNIITAAEEYSDLHYGLQFNVVFPRLFLVLPEPFQKKVEESRKVLNERIRLGIWGLLFLSCSILPFIRCYHNWHDFVASIRWSFIIIFIILIGIILGITLNLIFERIINSCVADFVYYFYLLAITKLLNDRYLRLFSFYFHTLIQQRLNSRQKKNIDLGRLGVRWIGWGILLFPCVLFPFIKFSPANWNDENPLILAIIVSLATILGSIIVIASAQQVATSAALSYAGMLRSAFDLYRFNLYNELKWPLPIFPKTERDEGIKLTQYLTYHDVSPGRRFKMTDFEQSVQINTNQFELQDFQYLIIAGNKPFEYPINLEIETVDYHNILFVISQVKPAFEKLKENERFFEILLQHPRHLENTRYLFKHFKEWEEGLMNDAGFHPGWSDALAAKIEAFIEKLTKLLEISNDVFPFLSWTDCQNIESRKREIKDIKSNLRQLESDLEELEVKVKEGFLEPQKIQETLDRSCFFLGGAALVFINCSTITSRSGLNQQFSELSILLGSILLVKIMEINID
ncbi:MAG: hypothetical protein QNJ55_10230 [Xenococcus sp. MO_188.B8]|nr:hypothetical protein [Xenococcus sp. MO_188.B8]